jgi:hypothetical protein
MRIPRNALVADQRHPGGGGLHHTGEVGVGAEGGDQCDLARDLRVGRGDQPEAGPKGDACNHNRTVDGGQCVGERNEPIDIGGHEVLTEDLQLRDHHDPVGASQCLGDRHDPTVIPPGGRRTWDQQDRPPGTAQELIAAAAGRGVKVDPDAGEGPRMPLDRRGKRPRPHNPEPLEDRRTSDDTSGKPRQHQEHDQDHRDQADCAAHDRTGTASTSSEAATTRVSYRHRPQHGSRDHPPPCCGYRCERIRTDLPGLLAPPITRRDRAVTALAPRSPPPAALVEMELLARHQPIHTTRSHLGSAGRA